MGLGGGGVFCVEGVWGLGVFVSTDVASLYVGG